MNPFTKHLGIAAMVIATGAISGCKKDTPTPATNASQNTDKYASVGAFLAKNAAPLQAYTITSSTGGNFTTSQGTKVTIPANAFADAGNNPVSGNITIEFKDIYTRSEMVFSDMQTTFNNRYPLKSGGEFYINARQGSSQLHPVFPNAITVTQPFNGWPADSLMRAFINIPNDTAGWVAPVDSSNVYVDNALSDYVFSLYSFSDPIDTGSWCNSDNPDYFASYTQTSLTLKGNDSAAVYGTAVFLLFHNLNSMVHVYNSVYSSFNYAYAPVGLQCTMVAVGVKDSTVYSSFVPVTIGSNQTVTFSLSPTTTAAFKTNLAAVQ